MSDEQEQPVIPKGTKVIDTKESLELTGFLVRWPRTFPEP